MESADPVIGAVAPDFTLPDQNNQQVRLSSFRGDSAVLLVFYPLAFSSICSGELRSLAQEQSFLERHSVTPLAISVDSMFVHKVWGAQESFPFPLLSDFWPHGEVAQAYGVFDANKGVAKRGTFLIDRGGIVRWRIVNELGQARDPSGYTSAVAALSA